MVNVGAGVNEATGAPYAVTGTDTPFTWVRLAQLVVRRRQREQPGQREQLHPDQRDPRSRRLPAVHHGRVLEGTTARAGRSPRTRARTSCSNIADISYKRRRGRSPCRGGRSCRSASYNTEPDWDHLFVEAHTVGQDNWTTLPDENEQHDDRDRAVVRLELAADLHPQLDHYQSVGRRHDVHGDRNTAQLERGLG